VSSARAIFVADDSSLAIASDFETIAGGATAADAVKRGGTFAAISSQLRSRKSVGSGCAA
jgi:hypothetical protein